MEIRDIPMSLIIFTPLGILFIELFVYALGELWKWFIGNGE
jgi:hypothetical protein